jgi:hypothetical protein
LYKIFYEREALQSPPLRVERAILNGFGGYCQCRAIELREQKQWEYYQRMKNKFEMQREHVRELTDNLDCIEH